MLHFYYGLMNSGKSNLLTIMYYSCRDNNKSVYVCKSRYDTRTSNTISTRVAIPGLKVDMLIDDQLDLDTVPGTKYDVILIDEVQFLTLPQIETLRRWAEIRDVYCFGLLLQVNDSLNLPIICPKLFILPTNVLPAITPQYYTKRLLVQVILSKSVMIYTVGNAGHVTLDLINKPQRHISMPHICKYNLFII